MGLTCFVYCFRDRSAVLLRYVYWLLIEPWWVVRGLRKIQQHSISVPSESVVTRTCSRTVVLDTSFSWPVLCMEPVEKRSLVMMNRIIFQVFSMDSLPILILYAQVMIGKYLRIGTGYRYSLAPRSFRRDSAAGCSLREKLPAPDLLRRDTL